MSPIEWLESLRLPYSGAGTKSKAQISEWSRQHKLTIVTVWRYVTGKAPPPLGIMWLFYIESGGKVDLVDWCILRDVPGARKGRRNENSRSRSVNKMRVVRSRSDRAAR